MRAAVLACLVVLAGCSAPAPQPPEDGFEDLGLEATHETGLIRGVVVDDVIAPLPGVEVVLDGAASQMTDEGGRFGFSRVEPGPHVLRFTKPGYGELERMVDVTAGQHQPPVVKVVLERLPGTEPHVVPLEWTGRLDCSLIVAGAFFAPCDAGATGLMAPARRYDELDTAPSFIQSELVWRATQTLGDNLCMRHYASDEGTPKGRVDPDACGPSPILQQVDGAFIVAEGLGNGTHLERVVWVAQRPDAPVGLATEQSFSLYTFVFYNTVPEGWLFVRDGDPPV